MVSPCGKGSKALEGPRHWPGNVGGGSQQYSNVEIKPKYENEDLELLWDIPEYSGQAEESDEHVKRPDGKLILKNEKMIYVLEMNVPWLCNKEAEMLLKEEKYRNIIRSLKLENPEYKVEQLNFIVDCLGGYGPSFKENVIKLGFTKLETEKICFGTQKILLSEARATINHFKISTSL